MTILIKGDHVRFEMTREPFNVVPGAFEEIRASSRIKGARDKGPTTTGPILALPENYGIIHDPEGFQLPFCDVYFGPFEVTQQKAQLTRKAKAYFGRGYEGHRAIVDIPVQGPWEPAGETIQIFYKRRGKDQRSFFHQKAQAVPLSRCTSRGVTHYRLELPDGCRLDDRGFVWP